MARKTGFSRGFVAILNDDEKIVADAESGLTTTGVFEINAKTSLGTVQAAISGLEPSVKKVYGSDQQVDVIAQGSGNVAMTLSANDMPEDVLAKLAGMSKDSLGGYYLSPDTIPPKTAVLLESHDKAGQPLWFALYKGTFGPEEVTLGTNQEAPNTTTDQIKFTALNRGSDGKVYGTWSQAKSKATLNDVMKDVFPGYTPTSSPVPVQPASSAGK